jgi:hypothetical protein
MAKGAQKRQEWWQHLAAQARAKSTGTKSEQSTAEWAQDLMRWVFFGRAENESK